MKKWLTYLFLLIAYLGYAQLPSSWQEEMTYDSARFSIRRDFLTLGKIPYKLEVGDAVAIFGKKLDSSYECVGYVVLTPRDTVDSLFRFAAYAQNGTGYGFIPGEACTIMVWDSKSRCQYGVYSDQTPQKLYGGSDIQINKGTSSKVSVGYLSAYYRGDKNPSPSITPALPLNSVRYNFVNGLKGDSNTGQIDLPNSTSGTVIFSADYCLSYQEQYITILSRIDSSSKLDISKLTFVPTYPTCTKPAGLAINTESVKGKSPFRYRVTNSASQEQWVNSSGLFQQLPEGIYQLQVSDSLDSVAIYHQPISLLRSEDCGNPVLAPDSKSGLETMYIEEQGTAKILNREGKVVKDLHVPANWDGSDNTGNALPMGDYYLFVNGNQSKVITIIR